MRLHWVGTDSPSLRLAMSSAARLSTIESIGGKLASTLDMSLSTVW